MLVKTYGSAVSGIDAKTITIEVDITRGIKFYLVGLPDNAVKESEQRIRAALKNNGYRVPGKQIVINMAPADIRKEGAAYDLTLAMGILAASKQIEFKNIEEYVIMGELSLDGSLQPIKGALPIAIKAKEEGFKGFILPKQNAKEAAIVEGIQVYGVENIKEVISFFDGKTTLVEKPFCEKIFFVENVSIRKYSFWRRRTIISFLDNILKICLSFVCETK